MKTETLKRIPYYLSVALLTGGASLIIGLLSFGGMFSIWPIWPLAIGTVALSASYEGEIYIQNIKSGINKLFLTPNYLKNHLTKAFLKHNFPLTEPRPTFFSHYEQQLLLLQEFKNKQLATGDKKRKKKIEKNLLDMETWFTNQLFLKRNRKSNQALNSPDFTQEVHVWLDTFKSKETKEAQNTLKTRGRLFYFVGGFSVLCAACMGIGTTYLLSETLLAIPLLTALSASIPPVGFIILATLAGAAYGLLIYNAITDMINNKTLQHLYNQLIQIKRKGVTLRNLVMTTTTVLLVLLAIALTVCTAGTWWAVARETTPVVSWIIKLPGFVMKIMNPILIGIASLFFNWQNTAETLELAEEIKKSPFAAIKEAFLELKTTFSQLPQHENWLQILNPARLLLKLTITPLRILFFIGHLASIAVTSDRIPGISPIISTLLGFISEGFEDAHYFFGHSPNAPIEKPSVTQILHEHFNPQDKRLDFPSWILKEVIFKPIYWLAITWDWAFSQRNPKAITGQAGPHKMSFSEAKQKQTGSFKENIPQKIAVPNSGKDVDLLEWQKELVIMKIEQFKKNHLQHAFLGNQLARQKQNSLSQLQVDKKRWSLQQIMQQSKHIGTVIFGNLNKIRKKLPVKLFWNN